MNIALILAGGTGTRLGADIPKQYIEIKGRPIIAYGMDTFFNNEKVDAVWIVADAFWQGFIEKQVKIQQNKEKFRGFARPGENRQLSIYSGLQEMQSEAKPDDLVIIHDAARPCLTKKLLQECICAAEGHDGVLPVLSMKDTVYYSDDGMHVDKLLKRSKVLAGQAPEAFRFGKYLEANQALLPEKILQVNGSTEPAVLAGMDIVTIPGDEKNYKVTTQEDLKRFRKEMER